MRKKEASDAAFSLIEVCMAIGVIAFAFVAILGMLPVGLGLFRQSMDTSVGSHIVQQVVNEAQQTDFPTLISTPTTTRYFDDQGVEVTAIKDSIYTVEILVQCPTVLPGSSAEPSSSLATLRIKIANNPAHRTSPFDGSTEYTEYSAMVANNL